MTPAERARLIEKQEFEAECKAARLRAQRYTAERRRQERQRVDVWIHGPSATVPFGPRPKKGRKPKLYTANDQTKTLSEWSACSGVSLATLQRRIRAGLTFDQIVTMEPRQRARLHTVNGVSKTLQQWADHIGISYDGLMQRLQRHPLAEAVAIPARRSKGAGVVSNFEAPAGTGAGSTAQESPEITFSEKAENA